jgi:DivIVA domain-containing protein
LGTAELLGVSALWVALGVALPASPHPSNVRSALAAVLGVTALYLTGHTIARLLTFTVVQLDGEELTFTGVRGTSRTKVSNLSAISSSSRNPGIDLWTGRCATFKLADGRRLRIPVGRSRRFLPLLTALKLCRPELPLDPDWVLAIMDFEDRNTAEVSHGSIPSDQEGEEDLVDMIRTKTFDLAISGYSVDEVDQWLETSAALASDRNAGLPVAHPRTPSFTTTLRGYDAHQVDAFVTTVLHAFDNYV